MGCRFGCGTQGDGLIALCLGLKPDRNRGNTRCLAVLTRRNSPCALSLCTGTNSYRLVSAGFGITAHGNGTISGSTGIYTSSQSAIYSSTIIVVVTCNSPIIIDAVVMRASTGCSAGSRESQGFPRTADGDVIARHELHFFTIEDIGRSRVAASRSAIGTVLDFETRCFQLRNVDRIGVIRSRSHIVNLATDYGLHISASHPHGFPPGIRTYGSLPRGAAMGVGNGATDADPCGIGFGGKDSGICSICGT